MKAVVVYESLWGNTAAVARAIAEGMGLGGQTVKGGQSCLDCCF
jgi:flavodoxin